MTYHLYLSKTIKISPKKQEFLLKNGLTSIFFDQNIQNEKDELVGEIIEYLIKDEERHFLESGKPDNHIYTKLIKLQNFSSLSSVRVPHRH